MASFVIEGEIVRVPAWVSGLESFRRWTNADEFPETGRISFIQGEVWVDLSREDLFTHCEVRSAITQAIYPLVKAGQLGHYFTRGAYLTNSTADLSHSPDGMFVSR